MLSSASDQVKSFAKKFSKNSNLDDSSILLPVFPFRRTNLKLLNIFITPKMVKKIIMNLDSSKASAPDCIPPVILKSCEPEFSYKNASDSQNIFCTQENIWISAVHIFRKENTVAENVTRSLSDNAEWQLAPIIFKIIIHIYC